jgi:hypothetical protein
VANFADIYRRMTKAGAAEIVEEASLADTIDRLLPDPKPAGMRARAFAEAEAAGILERILAALDPVVRRSRS